MCWRQTVPAVVAAAAAAKVVGIEDNLSAVGTGHQTSMVRIRVLEKQFWIE